MPADNQPTSWYSCQRQRWRGWSLLFF